MPVQNAEVAAMFDQAAELLEIGGENQFRVRAYRRAARVIEGLPQSVKSLLSAGRDLSELPGIGKDLAGKITEIVNTGRFKLLEGLKKKLPGELGEIATLPGLGPKRVKLLHDRLKVSTLDDLRRVVKAGKLHGVRGFGATIEKKLSAALEKPVADKRFKLSVAEAEAEALVSFLSNGSRVTVAGSYRRRRTPWVISMSWWRSAMAQQSVKGSFPMRTSPRCSPTARRARLSYCVPASKSIFARYRSKAMVQHFCISPVPKRTTSRSAQSPFVAAGSSMNTGCSPESGGLPEQPRQKYMPNSAFR